MGEIKSTLDIVLEKTRHLTLNPEEKAKQTQKEIGRRIKALLQKYQDGLLSAKQLQIDYETLKKDYDLADNTILINEIISRLDPDADPRLLLELLRLCGGVEPSAIETLVDAYRNSHHTAAQKRIVQLKEDLARNHFISGSAVVPNLEADEQWGEEVRRLRSVFEESLERARANLKAS